MKIVNYSDAAKIAHVTRQRISNIRSDIESGESRYQFLAYSTEFKKQGIDIEHPDWKLYCNKNKHHLNKKKPSKKQLKSKVPETENSQSVNQTKLIDSVVKAIKDIFEIEEKELNDLLELIEKYYEEG